MWTELDEGVSMFQILEVVGLTALARNTSDNRMTRKRHIYPEKKND
jgi:hypothetical protein